MSNRYIVPVIFTYQQKPIPSESVNQNNAAWAAAVNELVDDFRGASPPDNPVEGMTWLDTSGSRPVHRIYEGGIFKWFGIFVGTTAEKPLNPRKGAVFFDTTLSKAEYFNGTSWVKYSIAALSEDPAPALGGNLTVGSYKVGDATAADLTKLHGITATVDELNYVDGVTSAIQTQLDAKTDKSTLTTKGDIYVRDATGVTRLPVGADNETLIADSLDAKGVKWSKSIEDQIVDGVTTKAPSQNAVYDALAAKTDKSTLTTKGDLYVRDATGVTRLPIGSDNQVLTADSGQTCGIKWASPAGGGMKYQIFTSSGTFTVPSGVTSVKVTLIGGGGGGGGYNGRGSGGGGGGGVYYRKSQSVTSGSNITVTVGKGGAGRSTSNGGAGGTSSFGTYLSATGGGGGISDGGGGAAGSPATAHYTEAGFGGTTFTGGQGGSTMFGIGGSENRRAIGYGSGGGGARSGSTGGNGAPGVCIVEWEE